MRIICKTFLAISADFRVWKAAFEYHYGDVWDWNSHVQINENWETWSQASAGTTLPITPFKVLASASRRWLKRCIVAAEFRRLFLGFFVGTQVDLIFDGGLTSFAWAYDIRVCKINPPTFQPRFGVDGSFHVLHKPSGESRIIPWTGCSLDLDDLDLSKLTYFASKSNWAYWMDIEDLLMQDEEFKRFQMTTDTHWFKEFVRILKPRWMDTSTLEDSKSRKLMFDDEGPIRHYDNIDLITLESRYLAEGPASPKWRSIFNHHHKTTDNSTPCPPICAYCPWDLIWFYFIRYEAPDYIDYDYDNDDERAKNTDTMNRFISVVQTFRDKNPHLVEQFPLCPHSFLYQGLSPCEKKPTESKKRKR